MLMVIKQTPPHMDLPDFSVLSIRKMEKDSDGATVWSGTERDSHVSVKQGTLQSLMSCWYLILALRSFSLLSDWADEGYALYSSVCCGCQYVYPNASFSASS